MDDFPIICEQCLGTNEFMRMTRMMQGQACKVCSSPFTTFRWEPGFGLRYKRTEACPTCARLKNICQSCLRDLEFGMSTRIRDGMLGSSALLPKQDANRRWQLRQAESTMKRTGKGLIDYDRIESVAKQTLKAMDAPKSGKICQKWLKSKCSLGVKCPNLHELPHSRPKDDQPMPKEDLVKPDLPKRGKKGKRIENK